MLLGCGTVIAIEGDRSLVRFLREKCEGCPGSCFRVGKNEIEMWLEEPLRQGERIEIETSPHGLEAGVAIVLGLPMLAAVPSFLVTESWWIASISLVIGALLAVVCCRSSWFNRMLRPRVRVVG